jgi:hypothetical protein
MSRGYMGARSQFDLGDEDVALCENCDGSGWLIFNTRVFGSSTDELCPVALFITCADCNDDIAKPYPAPWPVCVMCEEQKLFCRCGPILIN